MGELRQMVDMELSDDESLDTVMPIPGDRPQYPYGLRICLTHQEFDKLGLDWRDAFVGGIVHGHFMGRITSVTASDHENNDDGPTARVEIQIESLLLESEDSENDEAGG